MALPVKTECVLLSTAYLPPVEYVAWMWRSETCRIEQWESYRKQTYRNRCMIATTGGKLSLTIPVEKPGPGNWPVREVRISDHGNWQHLHWNALVSAYRSTPFFEYYEDDFAPFYEKRWKFLVDYNEELLHLICSLIGFEPVVQRTEHFLPKDCSEASSSAVSFSDSLRKQDLREAIDPKKRKDTGFKVHPYYQVFASQNGFQGNLSSVDLLFNMGPQSLLILQDSFH